MTEFEDTKSQLLRLADAAIEASEAVYNAEADLDAVLDEFGDVLVDMKKTSCTRHGYWIGWEGDENHIEMVIREQDTLNLDMP